MFRVTLLCHGLVEWQINKGVHPNSSKSQLNEDRADHSKYCNYKTASGKNALCCVAMGCKLLTSPGIVDTYTFRINTWNTLPKRYQQRVFKNNFATVKHQIQQVENRMPAMVISMEAARVDNAILLYHLTLKVACRDPNIESPDTKIPIDNNCMNHDLHLGTPVSSGDYKDDGDECNQNNAVPTTSGCNGTAAHYVSRAV